MKLYDNNGGLAIIDDSFIKINRDIISFHTFTKVPVVYHCMAVSNASIVSSWLGIVWVTSQTKKCPSLAHMLFFYSVALTTTHLST